MNTNVSGSVAALTIDSADPAALADFWGKALGHPVSPGAITGDISVDAPSPESGPRLILHNPPEAGTAKNSFKLVLITDHFDAEIKRLTSLGARSLYETKHPPVRAGNATFHVSQTTFADPEGNEFELVQWKQQPE